MRYKRRNRVGEALPSKDLSGVWHLEETDDNPPLAPTTPDDAIAERLLNSNNVEVYAGRPDVQLEIAEEEARQNYPHLFSDDPEQNSETPSSPRSNFPINGFDNWQEVYSKTHYVVSVGAAAKVAVREVVQLDESTL